MSEAQARSEEPVGPYRSSSDEELVAAIRSGDRAAWSELVGRYESQVLAIPLRLGLSYQDAEEVFQCTWKTLFEHVQAIRDPGRVAAWIATTARREAWRIGRASSGPVLSDELAEAPDRSASPEGEALGREERERVLQAVEELDPRCRLLLTRLFLDRDTPSYEAIGRELQIPIGSIGPTRLRCLEKHARRLGAPPPEEEPHKP